MLEEIRIRGLGVISDAALEFGAGLTVVTGETGAGKTMVINGLALLFGGRADYSRLRAGLDSASVEGRLLVAATNPAADVVTDAGGDLEADGTLILRRVISAGGRSRAAAGGASVPAGVLTKLGESLLVVHGQSDQQRLTRPGEQRLTLDRYAGLDLIECRNAFHRWRAATSELDRRLSSARELAREAELLRYGIEEISAVAPQIGEDIELAAQSSRLEHVDSLRVAARAVHDALLGDRENPTGEVADVQSLLGGARQALQHVQGTDPELDRLASRLLDLIAEAADLGADIAMYEGQLDFDPSRLAAVHERRSALSSLYRKYGPDVASVLKWAADAVARLEESDTSEDALAALRHERDQAEASFIIVANKVSARRAEAAARLSKAISAELAGLAMGAARVAVNVHPRPAVESSPTVTVSGRLVGAGPDGLDDVEITLQPHPDAPALPVQRGASGGELSRVMLAIEVVLAGTDPVPTMVFDEVDAGVGGRSAVEVGRRLSRLADKHQVIVVTHLAQVAAFAGTHLVVDKLIADQAGTGEASTGEASTGEGVTRSDIRRVQGADRLAELARMLGGDTTEVALEHAAQLLETAGQEQAGTTGNGRTQLRSPAQVKRARSSHTRSKR